MALNVYYLYGSANLAFDDNNVYVLPDRNQCNGTYAGHTLVSYPIEDRTTGDWLNNPNRRYGSEFFRSTGYILDGTITIYDGVLYSAFQTRNQQVASVPAQTGRMDAYYADGWVEVAVDDLFTMYPDSFKVSGHKSAEDSYKDDWRDAGHILSGADGCCEIFW